MPLVEMGLLIELVGREDKLYLTGASSVVALRTAAALMVLAVVTVAAIAADTEGMIGQVVPDSLGIV